MPPDKTGEKQAKTQFKPGQSGNPGGRPVGSKHKATLAMEALMEGQAEQLAQAAVDKALEGDSAALRLCLERLFPVRKGRPIQFDLPPVKTAHDILTAQASVLGAVSDGTLTPDEGNTVSGMLETKRRALETVEIEERLSRLEEGVNS